ncbi:MAG TPA: hypothetical protein VF503_02930 [Sphingobium sp.]|uniref:hypothetical protein n=1 Tax=Sphingobium sp. TaxID=1912891 RepID=UPI002ED4BFDF
MKRRGTALVLTILVHLLMLLLLLLTHGPQIVKKVEDNGLVTFSVMPDAQKKNAGEKTKAETKQADKAAAAPNPKPAEPAPPSVAPKPKDETPSFIQLSPSDFAAADVGKIPSRGAANGAGGSTGNSKAVAGPGEGPGGVQLYEAEWYRRPTDAELATYMPPNPPREGWGLVACKTIENFHVENCQTLGESPTGSGLAKAVRQAAWQFLVRPPRIDGKSQVGAWVRIRIDYTQHVVLDGAGG